MQRNLTILLLLPLLAGCLAQSRIQEKYMSDESSCRDEAEKRGQQLPNANGVDASGRPSDTSYVVASTFSDCMHKVGWKVSTPKAPGAAAATPAPAAAVAAAPAVLVPAPAGNATGVVAAPILGPGVQPNPAIANTAVPAAAPVGAVAVTPVSPAAAATAPTTAAPDAPAPAAVAPTGSPATSNTVNGVSSYQPDVPDYGKAPR